jgi:hypothetical protein
MCGDCIGSPVVVIVSYAVAKAIGNVYIEGLALLAALNASLPCHGAYVGATGCQLDLWSSMCS